MEKKDNRHKEKRRIMREKKTKQGFGLAHSSSDNLPSGVRSGMVDVMDSSDEKRFQANHRTRDDGWISAKVAPQQRKLDLPPQSYDNTAPGRQTRENYESYLQMQAGDFYSMSQMPATLGHHFKFSSEKSWDDNQDTTGNSLIGKYFMINLQLVNASLSTIPFYKRMNYPSSLFTDKEKRRMEADAEMADAIYQAEIRNHFQIHRIPRKQSSGGGGGSGSANRTNENILQESASVRNDVDSKIGLDDELNELLSLTTQQVGTLAISGDAYNIPVSITASVAAPPTVKDDVQQWLDNVLEE